MFELLLLLLLVSLLFVLLVFFGSLMMSTIWAGIVILLVCGRGWIGCLFGVFSGCGLRYLCLLWWGACEAVGATYAYNLWSAILSCYRNALRVRSGWEYMDQLQHQWQSGGPGFWPPHKGD